MDQTSRNLRNNWRQWLALSVVAILLIITATTLWRRSARQSPRAAAIPAKKPAEVEPNKLRVNLVDEVAKEPADKLLDRLFVSFNDIALATVGAPTFRGSHPEGYEHACLVVPKLVRVRRVFEEYRGKPEKVIPKLRAMLPLAVENFDQVYDTYDTKHFLRGKNSTDPFSPFPEQDTYYRAIVNSQAAVYLLAEFRDFHALPVLAEVFEGDRPIVTPVSRVFVFYAMHTLALEHPRDGLSPEARAALADYLSATAKDVPPPEDVSRTAWNAPIADSDFRSTMLGMDVGLDRQRQVRMRAYPYDLEKYEDPAVLIGRRTGEKMQRMVAPQVRVWYAKLKRFIELAYPKGQL